MRIALAFMALALALAMTPESRDFPVIARSVSSSDEAIHNLATGCYARPNK